MTYENEPEGTYEKLLECHLELIFDHQKQPVY